MLCTQSFRILDLHQAKMSYFLPLPQLWHFGPFSGLGLPVGGVRKQLSLHEVMMRAPRPTPNKKGQGISLCLALAQTCTAYVAVPAARQPT